MQDENLKLNPGLSRQKQLSRNEDSFRQKIGLKFKEKTGKVQHFVHSLLWWRNVDFGNQIRYV